MYFALHRFMLMLALALKTKAWQAYMRQVMMHESSEIKQWAHSLMEMSSNS
jgi:hypothetical protein